MARDPWVRGADPLPTPAAAPAPAPEYASTEAAVAAGATGVLEGIAGPAGTAVAKALLGKQDLQGVEQAHPVAHQGSKIATTIGMSLLGGGLPGAIGKAGSAAAAIGGGSKILGGAIGMGTEAALYGVSDKFSDAILTDHPIRAQELAADAIKNFGIGALFGGVGGAIGAGLGKLKGSSVIEDAAASRFADAAGYNKRVSDGIKAARGGEQGYYKAVREVWDDAESQLGKKLRSIEDIVAAKDKGVTHWGNKIGSILDDAERKLPGQADAGKVIGNIEAVAAKLKADPTAGPLQARIEGIAARAKDQWLMQLEDGSMAYRPMTLRDAKEISTQFREKFLRTEASSNTPVGQVAKEIRDSIEGEIKTALEKVGSKALVNEYGKAKGMYQNYAWLDDALEAGANKAVHAPMGMREIAAAASGIASGSPLAGAAMAVGSKMLKTPTANLIIGDTLKRAASLDGINLVNTQASRAIRTGIAEFAGEISSPKPKREPPAPRKEMYDLLDTVHSATPDSITESATRAISAKIDPSVAPALFTQANMVVNRAAMYLSATAPKPLSKSVTLTPIPEKNRYSDLQMYQWGLKVEGVKNPYSLLTDMRNGNLSRAKVEAVREVHPEIYEGIKEGILEYVTGLDKPLPYAKTVQISTLFESPVDDTLQPDFIRMMQGSVGPVPGEQNGKPSKGRPSAVSDTLSDQLKTASETIGDDI